jgi:hypothetical protein
MNKLKEYANKFWNLLSPVARAALIGFVVGLLVGWIVL